MKKLFLILPVVVILLASLTVSAYAAQSPDSVPMGFTPVGEDCANTEVVSTVPEQTAYKAEDGRTYYLQSVDGVAIQTAFSAGYARGILYFNWKAQNGYTFRSKLKWVVNLPANCTDCKNTVSGVPNWSSKTGLWTVPLYDADYPSWSCGIFQTTNTLEAWDDWFLHNYK